VATNVGVLVDTPSSLTTGRRRAARAVAVAVAVADPVRVQRHSAQEVGNR
jgi:hypothetical protein